MTTHDATPLWSTSSYGTPVETSPMELSALCDHLGRCQDSRGRLFTLRCVAETLDRFVAPRFVTTLVVAALVIGIASLVL
jgi:hypothetical protein